MGLRETAAEGSGGVSSEFGDEAWALRTGGEKEKRNVPDKAERECLGESLIKSLGKSQARMKEGEKNEDGLREMEG